MKIFAKAFTACLMLLLSVSLFCSCQGTDGLCYANLEFEVTDNGDCGPNQYVGFDLLFVDKQGNEIIKSYVIPAIIQSPVIALPPGRSYDVYMRNNGVQEGCAGKVYFDIVALDPDDDVECFRVSVDADERPGFFNHIIASFDLDHTCDSCPNSNLD